MRVKEKGKRNCLKVSKTQGICTRVKEKGKRNCLKVNNDD
jgi:hypothetical protein